MRRQATVNAVLIVVAVLLGGCRTESGVAGPERATEAAFPSGLVSSSPRLYAYTRSVSDIRAVGDSVWVATSGALIALDRQTLRFDSLVPIPVATTLPPSRPTALIDNDLWLATGYGLVRFTPSTRESRVMAPVRVRQLDYQPKRDVLWALGVGGAVRVDLKTGDVRTWENGDWSDGRVVGDEIWNAHGPRWADHWIWRYAPLTGDERTYPYPGNAESGTIGRLSTTEPAVWVQFGPYHGIRGLARIDRQSGELRTYTAADGLPGDYVRAVQAHGDDVWTVCSATRMQEERRGLEWFLDGTLAHLDARSGRWEAFPAISGATRDEPTALKEIDGDIWVATQGYKRTRKMIVGWRIEEPYEHEAPVVQHISLSRWRPAKRAWETVRFPAEHNYTAIVDFWVTTTHLWMAINRTDVEDIEQVSGRSERGGLWLASCPRNGGDLTWHFRLRPYGRRSGLGEPVRGIAVADDTVWWTSDERTKRLDPAAGKWRDVDWPSPLPEIYLTDLVARDGRVLAATCYGTVLALAEGGEGFERLARVTMSGPEYVPGTTTATATADGTDTRQRQAQESKARWGPPVAAQITQVALGPDGTAWLTGVGGPFQVATKTPGEAPEGVPDVFAPAGLMRLAADRWETPSLQPWSTRHRGEAGENRFTAPPIPDTTYTPHLSAGATLIGPGERGVNCLLPDGGTLWLGSGLDGLYALNDSRWERLGPRKPLAEVNAIWAPPENQVMALARIGDWLYVATEAQLYRLHVAEHRWEEVTPYAIVPELYHPRHIDPPPPSHEGPSFTPDSFLIELNGEVWMSIRAGPEAINALYRLRPGADTPQRYPLDSPVKCAATDGEHLYVGTREGLLRLNPAANEEKWIRGSLGIGVGLAGAQAIAIDKELLWIARPNAITCLAKDEFERHATDARPKPPRWIDA